MAKHSDEESFKMTKTALWQIISGLLLILLVISVFTNGFGIMAAPRNNGGTNNTGNTANGGNTGTNNVMQLFNDDVAIGPKDAKVTIIEYSDPSCPFCAAAAGGAQMLAYMQQKYPGYQAAVPNIMKDYVNTNKVQMVFRYFPGHGAGSDAMKILLCANEQGKFWSLSDVLWNNQDAMNNGDVAKLKQLAVNNSVDSSKLDACLATGKYDAKLNTDTQRGVQAGVQGTPAFFINGKLISGAASYPDFKTAIDAALTA